MSPDPPLAVALLDAVIARLARPGYMGEAERMAAVAELEQIRSVLVQCSALEGKAVRP